MLRSRSPLDQRVKRHAVKRAKGTKQRQVREYPPTPGPAEELLDRTGGCPAGCRLRKIQVDREQAQPDRTEWHEAELDSVAGKTLAEQRAHADADSESDQQQRGNRLTAVEDVERISRDQRRNRCPEEPEPRDPEY